MTAIAANNVANIFPSNTITGLDLDQYLDLVEDSNVVKTLDIGTVIISIVNHPIHGQLVLANTNGETHAAVRL